MLGALATAGKEILALATIAGKTVAFLYAETEKLGLTLQVNQVFGADIAQFVFGVYEVVAHVDVAIVLHYEAVAAGGAEGAERGLHAIPLGEGDVEELYEALSYIIDDPLVEHIAHELAEGFRGDAPGGYL